MIMGRIVDWNRLVKDATEKKLTKRSEMMIEGEKVKSDSLMVAVDARDYYIQHIGFSIITKELVDELAGELSGKRVIEIGCGLNWLGYWMGMEHPEIDYTTLDDNSWSRWSTKPYRPVDITADYATADLSGYDVILISWPDYQRDGICRVIEKMKPGQQLIYCGEGQGGCTGSDEMFELLEHDFVRAHTFEYSMSFFGMHDYWCSYTKQ
jgi:hypothetical protein